MDGLKMVPKSPKPESCTATEVIASPALSVGKEKLYCAISDNFESIIHLAAEVASIQKMKIQSAIAIQQMREAREQLLAEAQVYVQKKDADTRSVVERMEVIRSMMNDFYQHSSQNLTSEDFCKIITEIINQMGKLEHD